MLVHESWREEFGWLFILFGFATCEYGVINKLAPLEFPKDPTWSMVIIVGGAVLFLVGVVMHVTRPSKRTTQEAQEATADQQAEQPAAQG